ncbi:MAG: prepilin peptidase [Myxococcota bacterium]
MPILGSFLATICLRWPRCESTAAGRSHCDGCRWTRVAHHLVPVVSYLAQRGRCRGCGHKIDPLHIRADLAAATIGAVRHSASLSGCKATVDFDKLTEDFQPALFSREPTRRVNEATANIRRFVTLPR